MFEWDFLSLRLIFISFTV
ncbi:hypothetical protein RRG08_037550 [Elysia crispata]|uniref:Uncharacterized protein n=1 Tax=Elysia crispata TaxID=231223 RepID=A0AAE0Y7K1_9GAST|nr:hypothetical protein RRG08_037550 [Elysia crispata]